MRVLIINSNRERAPWPVPPVGACAVAASAEGAGHPVHFLDLCFSRRPERDVKEAVERFRPQVIGISVRNIDNVDWQAPKFYLEEVKRRVVEPCRSAARCPIVIGGPAVGIMPAELLEYLGADFAVCGDGEAAFVRLLEVLSDGGALGSVPGLAYRAGGAVTVSEPARVASLDSLPMVHAHRWLDMRRYLAYNGSLGIQTKRGCALACSYCVYNRIEGRCYRLKSPDRVAREVAEAIGKSGADSIEFVDSTFNFPLDHAMDVCRALIAGGLRARFSTMGINPGAVTEELFALLREANFTEVSITPETASEPMLESLGKNFGVRQIHQAVEIARRARLPVVWYFMFGAPGETAETVRETLDFIEARVPRSHLVLLVSGVRIFKGAPLEAVARREGQLGADADLLKPVWYQPPVPKATLFDMLERTLRRLPNCIALQDNSVPRPLLRAASALHRFCRGERPLWHYLRHLRRVTGALGLPSHLTARL